MNEVLELIKQAAIDQVTFLRLRNKQLTFLPSEIGQLTKVEFLNLSGNELTSLPSEVGQLTNLERLDLSGNQLTAFPKELLRLTKLRQLNLSGNRLTSLPSEVGQLAKLEFLGLSGNELTALPREISQLTELASLHLGKNRLASLPGDVGKLSKLQHLYLRDNQLTSLPSEVGQLTELGSLDLRGNQLKSLPCEIGQLTKLLHIHLHGNKLTSVPAEIGQLTNLTGLGFSDNQLTSLPSEVGQLSKLTQLYLDGNQLTSVPAEIGQLTKLMELDLHGNQLPGTISTLLERGIEVLLTYLRSVAEGERLFEAKLLFVGEGKVGKSSLVAALRGEAFIEDRETTHGIELRSLDVPHPETPDTNITLNAWDFGGQPVYQATHQFFFSRRSLYLILWSPRLSAEQCDVDGWIKRIKLRVGNEAKVIVIATHCDSEGRIARINETQLRRDYDDVLVGFHEVDSLTNTGVETLKELIARVAAGLPQMGLRINQRWKAARDEVLGIQHPRISFREYSEICAKHGLEDQETSTLADFMDISGNIVYYADDDGLKDEVILQPEWMSKAIGYVLEDNETNKRNGILPHTRLRHIWYDHGDKRRDRYDPSLHPFFLRLMERYDVSYRLDDAASSLVAQHVPNEQPDVPWCPGDPSKGHQLKLVCAMSEQPPGVVPWMIVRTHRFSTNRHWQSGMFLEYGDHGDGFLELRDREFHIAVRGVYPPHFTSLLSDTLTCLIEQRWPGLKYELSVPCPNVDESGKPCAGRFQLDALRSFLADGDETIRCQDCRDRLSITRLIHGFGTTPDRAIVTRMEELHGEASAERRELHRIASEERKKLASQGSELLRVAIRALATETRECPRLFTLLPEKLKKINPANWGKSSQRLTLWCEYSDRPHPVCRIGSGEDGEYVISQPQEWLVAIAPYARFVAKFLEIGVPLLGTAAKHALDPKIFESVESHVDLMNDLTNGLMKISKSSKDSADDYTSQDAPATSGLSKAEGSGLRQLLALLSELDPARGWGGLRRALSPTGDYLWLCPIHYREYDPGLPDKGFD